MQRSDGRILTTHTGSLPRPADILDLVSARETGALYDHAAFDHRISEGVTEIVRKQANAGIDIVSDGELSKAGFFQYVHARLQGIEILTPGVRYNDDPDFPGYWAWRQDHGFAATLIGGWPECTGPLSWRDFGSVETDIANLKAAQAAAGVREAFVPCASIGIIAQRIANRHYPTYETYVEAIAELMKDEYRAVADAGLILQIDAPEFAIDRNLPEWRNRPFEEFAPRIELWVEALNHALAGIPEEQIRFHVCWGNLEHPHVRDVPLEQLVGYVLRVRAGAYSVEASNPRHAHEWRVWEQTKLPEGKTLIPGVIDSTTNFVEHPRLVADRILTYARLVGRENVIAGTDCGFGTSAVSNNVYPAVVWAKLRTLAEGAALASRELWP